MIAKGWRQKNFPKKLLLPGTTWHTAEWRRMSAGKQDQRQCGIRRSVSVRWAKSIAVKPTAWQTHARNSETRVVSEQFFFASLGVKIDVFRVVSCRVETSRKSLTTTTTPPSIMWLYIQVGITIPCIKQYVASTVRLALWKGKVGNTDPPSHLNYA